MEDQKQQDQQAPVDVAVQVAALQKENEALRGELAGLKTAVDQLMIKPATEATAAAPVVPKDSFKVGGKKFKFKLPVVTIPKVGKRTALEILMDTEKHAALGGKTIKEWLVANNSNMIEEAE